MPQFIEARDPLADANPVACWLCKKPIKLSQETMPLCVALDVDRWVFHESCAVTYDKHMTNALDRLGEYLEASEE